MTTLKRIIQQRRQPTSQHARAQNARDARVAMQVHERLERATKRPDRRSDR